MAKNSITAQLSYGGEVGIVKKHVASYTPISNHPYSEKPRLEVHMVNGAKFTILSTFSEFYNHMIEV